MTPAHFISDGVTKFRSKTSISTLRVPVIVLLQKCVGTISLARLCPSSPEPPTAPTSTSLSLIIIPMSVKTQFVDLVHTVAFCCLPSHSLDKFILTQNAYSIFEVPRNPKCSRDRIRFRSSGAKIPQGMRCGAHASRPPILSS